MLYHFSYKEPIIYYPLLKLIVNEFLKTPKNVFHHAYFAIIKCNAINYWEICVSEWYNWYLKCIVIMQFCLEDIHWIAWRLHSAKACLISQIDLNLKRWHSQLPIPKSFILILLLCESALLIETKGKYINKKPQ